MVIRDAYDEVYASTVGRASVHMRHVVDAYR